MLLGRRLILSVIDGNLQVGESSDKHSRYHTLVLSTQDGEDGVQLTRPTDSEGETRFVLIAGEPLDQEVVQVSRVSSHHKIETGWMLDSVLTRRSMDLSWSIPNNRPWRPSWTLDRARMGLKMLLDGRARLVNSFEVKFCVFATCKSDRHRQDFRSESSEIEVYSRQHYSTVDVQ